MTATIAAFAATLPHSLAVDHGKSSSSTVTTATVTEVSTADSPPPAANATSTFSVPTIDIGPYLSDPTSEASASIIAAARSACRTSGFFQITGHGIPADLQQAVFSGAKQFFRLPFETKKALDAKTVRGHRGYDVLASQSYGQGLSPDLKEGFYVGPDLDDAHPWVRAGRFFMGRNVWPEDALLASAAFREPAEQYHAALMQLSKSIMALVADTLPYGKNVFDEFVGGDAIAPMRMLHYPPARTVGKDEEGRPQFGASAHTDFGAITLLLQDEQPGLEVRDGEGVWHGVEPNKEAYVVNVGDMLSRWTGGEYISSVHRVLNKNKGDRYSVVFFFDGNPDAELRKLDGSENNVAKEDVLTVEKHMINRMTESYGRDENKSKGV